MLARAWKPYWEQHRHVAGGVDQGRPQLANLPDQHQIVEPDLGFFTSGAFIGDDNGIAASNWAIYPVWTDGRHNAIDQTGIGESDIFTNVELG